MDAETHLYFFQGHRYTKPKLDNKHTPISHLIHILNSFIIDIISRHINLGVAH